MGRTQSLQRLDLKLGCLLVLVVTPALAYAFLRFSVGCNGHGGQNDASAIYALKALHAGQTRFRREDWDRDGKPDYASLSELDSCGVAEVKFGEFRARQGYLFEVWRNAGPGHVWWGKASPAVLGTTGDRYFYVNREGAIYFSLVELPLPPRIDKVARLGS